MKWKTFDVLESLSPPPKVRFIRLYYNTIFTLFLNLIPNLKAVMVTTVKSIFANLYRTFLHMQLLRYPK